MNNTQHITQIYLVENCYGDPNKVYIGKEKIEATTKRKSKHIKKYGNGIVFSYIDMISSLNSKDWKPLECYWIEQFRQWGFDIQNKNDGGGGPSLCSYEAKQKMIKSHVGFKHSEETKEKIRLSKAGKKLSDKTKKIMSDNSFWKGKKRPEETKEKMRGQKRSEETKSKMKLKKLSNESKGKIGKSNSKPKPIYYGINLSKLMKEGLAEKISKANIGISRNKGREITWDVGRPKTIIYQIKDDNIIKTWYGIEKLQDEYPITGIYRAFKTQKEYKGFTWKKENQFKKITKPEH